MGTAQFQGRSRQGALFTTSMSVLRLLAPVLHHGVAKARPFLTSVGLAAEPEAPKSAEDPSMWIYLSIAVLLVLLGGAFAGLTIALMGQDELYLQVIASSGEASEKRNARKVLKLLKKGKHWVLVTLLVGNVITNETLPIVLDRSIGGGYAAAIASTVLVIVFGEILPQSVCVRFGLPIGAWTAPFVLALMWIFSPITYPIAKLLDRLLGEDHGTMYKKAGLKTLVTLHKTTGATSGERLNQDEVTIISGVLDLKTKAVDSIMTPMEDVFTISADAVLDEDMMNVIMREGYSRIPVHDPHNPTDFVGMLLVKMLITYDPEDARKVRDFSLATLPETQPDTSCLDIINFFQQGKSHMVLVSDYPGESYGALGVVTLEDVIEELIGEEIVDESDVFVDVHKAIRRIPAPFHGYLGRTRAESLVEVVEQDGGLDKDDARENNGDVLAVRPASLLRSSTTSADANPAKSPKTTTFLVRRKNSLSGETRLVKLQQNTSEMKEQLRNLGPASSARQPKPSRVSTVKIKPGVNTIPEHEPLRKTASVSSYHNVETPVPTDAQHGIGEDLITPGLDAKDGVQAIQAGYGTWDGRQPWPSPSRSREHATGDNVSMRSSANDHSPKGKHSRSHGDHKKQRKTSHSTIGSLPSREGSPSRSREFHRKHSRRTTARSGSITENVIDAGGVKKLVLEMTSSSEDVEAASAALLEHRTGGSRNLSRAGSHRSHLNGAEEEDEKSGENGTAGQKKRRRQRKRKKKVEEGGVKITDENTLLLKPPSDDWR